MKNETVVTDLQELVRLINREVLFSNRLYETNTIELTMKVLKLLQCYIQQ